MVSPKTVARAIGVSEASLKRWCDKGILPVTRTAGGHRRIPIAGVIQFLRETGQPVVHPELLSLPAKTGRNEQPLEQSVEALCAAVDGGDWDQFRRLVLGAYLAKCTIADICDRLIAPAFHRVGELWDHGSLDIYQERRGCELCQRTLQEVISMLPAVPTAAPLAIGATVEGDHYMIPTKMVEAVLRELGWNAQAVGTNVPIASMCAAIRDVRPRLFWMSVSYLCDAPAFVSDYNKLYETAVEQGAALVIGGRALTQEIRQSIRFATFGDNLQHLVAYVQSLR